MRHVISSDLGVEEASDGYFLVVKTPNPGVCHIISLDLGVEDENRAAPSLLVRLVLCRRTHAAAHAAARATAHHVTCIPRPPGARRGRARARPI